MREPGVEAAVSPRHRARADRCARAGDHAGEAGAAPLPRRAQAAHALDDLLYTNVGYGTSEKVVIHGSGPAFPFDGLRKWTVSAYHALDQSFIHLNQNLNQGWSGTGYGDSGGPTFVDVGNGPVQISVVSTGDVPLYSTSVNTRIDTDDARDFLDPFLALS